MPDTELRLKDELTSIVGTENIYIQEAGSPFTVKRTLLNTIRAWILATPTSTGYKQASYVGLDNDGYGRIEFDTTAGAVSYTLPLMANNARRRIEIAFVKADASADVVTISPHATDANKLSNDLLASIILAKVGDFLVVQESVNSGCWEVVNERITSQLRLNTYAGYGSTDNKIMRFTNVVENFGNMFSENHVSGYNGNADGLEITINRSGKYSFTFNSGDISGVLRGISLNSSELTTAFATININTKIATSYSSSSSAAEPPTTIMIYLTSGSVVRPHTDGSGPSTVARSFFTCTYLGN